jgi:hypothetical protein
MPHAYDNPELSAVQFLLAVMRDQSVPLYLRIDAARAAAPYEHAPIRVMYPDLVSEVQGRTLQ